MKSNQENIDLITRVLTKEASIEEIEELNTWLNANPENQNQFQKYQKVYELTETRTEAPDIDIDTEWNVLLKTIQETKSTKISQTNVWLRIAASVALIAGIGFSIFNYVSAPAEVYLATTTELRTFDLPDGSLVTLNKNSELIYENQFGSMHRNVELKGEAFFDVESNQAFPFIISTGKTSVEVVGTSFNVQAYANNPFQEVVVTSGKVKFYSDSQNTVILNPGDKGTYHKASILLSKTNNEDSNFLSWKTKKIVFSNQGLAAVVKTINRIYNSEIVISTDVKETCAVTVTFENQSLESILNVLKSTLNLNFEANGNKILITGAGC